VQRVCIKAGYGEDCESQYAFFRPVVDEVIEEFFKRGDLDESFACELLAGMMAPIFILVFQVNGKDRLAKVRHPATGRAV
jgi:hypothetical protein